MAAFLNQIHPLSLRPLRPLSYPVLCRTCTGKSFTSQEKTSCRLRKESVSIYLHERQVAKDGSIVEYIFSLRCSLQVHETNGCDAQNIIFLNTGATNNFRDCMITQIGITNRSKPSADLRLLEYEKAAKVACGATSFEEAHNLFPSVPLFDLPYLCMDLVYVYAVLVDGFGIDPTKLVTAVNSVPYGDSSMGVQWALGLALELLSSNYTKMPDITNVLLASDTNLVQIV